MLELGKAIRIVREAKGMRLAMLAERGGVSVPFLSLVENGERQPSLVVLRKLAEGLGIPPETLILLSQPPGGNLRSGDQASQSLITAIKKLIAVEDDLRSKIALGAKAHASKSTDR